jgi:hypothetical protein
MVVTVNNKEGETLREPVKALGEYQNIRVG